MKPPEETIYDASRLILPHVPAYLISAETAISAAEEGFAGPDTSLSEDRLVAAHIAQIRATEAIARALMETNVLLSRIVDMLSGGSR